MSHFSDLPLQFAVEIESNRRLIFIKFALENSDPRRGHLSSLQNAYASCYSEGRGLCSSLITVFGRLEENERLWPPLDIIFHRFARSIIDSP